MTSCLLKSPCLLSLPNLGAKYVGNKIQFASAIHWQKKLLKIQQNSLCIMSAMALAYPNILPRALIWFCNSWEYLFYGRTHYPMLEKFGTKYLAACENQGKQHKLRVMKKKPGRGWCKKYKRLTDNQVVTKDFT